MQAIKGTLGKRLLLLSLLALVLTISISTGFSVESFRRQYREGILRRSNILATALKSQVEVVLGLGLPLTQIEGLAERCQAIVSNDPEISYCLIEEPGGTILYRSTTMMFEPAQAQLVGSLDDGVTLFDSSEYGGRDQDGGAAFQGEFESGHDVRRRTRCHRRGGGLGSWRAGRGRRW